MNSSLQYYTKKNSHAIHTYSTSHLLPAPVTTIDFFNSLYNFISSKMLYIQNHLIFFIGFYGSFIFSFLSFFLYIINVILLQLSHFFPFALLCLALPPTPTVNPHTVVHLHGSCITCCLFDPFPSFRPSFHCYLPLPSSLAAVSLFHVFMSLVY